MNRNRTRSGRARGAAAVPVLLSLLAFVACGGEGSANGNGATAQARGGPGRGGPGGPGGLEADRVVPVQTAPVERGSIARSVTVSGVIEPIRTVGVNSQLAGAVLSVEAEESDYVREGALLARMDDRELSAQLRAADANLEVARAAFERAQQLRDRNVITLPEFERERTALAAATATVDQLRTRIGYTRIAAPVSGVITEKRVEAGDVVGNQTRLFTIADVSTMVVRVGVSELDVGDLSRRDVVDIALDAQPGQLLRGRIRRIFPAGDPTTRLVPVEVALDGPSARLARPGFLARTTFALGTRNDVLLVPQSAVVGVGGSQSVFVVENGHAIRRTVASGLTSRGLVEILSGLREGETVITVGNNLLRDGMEVRVVNEAGPASQLTTPAAPAGASETAPPAAATAPPPASARPAAEDATAPAAARQREGP